MKQSTGAGGFECAALLRFPVTWSYLNRTGADSGPVSAAGPVVAPPKPRPATIAPAPPKPPAVDAVPAHSGPSAQWEMVVPKMVRPPAAPVRLQIAEVPEPAPARAPAPAPTSAEMDFAPALIAQRSDTFLGRHGRWIAVVVVALVGTGIATLVRPDATTSRGTANEAESGISGGWTRSGLSAAGRMVSVYDPSRAETDYRAEFSWVPDASGVGWLFRIRDASNYYGARLSQLQPGSSSALVLEHFEVVGGVEGAHTRKVIPQTQGGSAVRIRMDVAGPAFTLWAQGSPADYWTDARLASGPFGFYDERGQRPSLQTVRFTFLKKGAARVAVTSFR